MQMIPPHTHTIYFIINVTKYLLSFTFNDGWKASIVWAAAGYIVGVGPYLGAISAVSTIKSQKAAAEILKLTKKNKKVHITSSYGMISVTAWNGSKSKITTSAPASKKTTTGGITTVIKTTITKNKVKYTRVLII
jgi:hypothetical protein